MNGQWLSCLVRDEYVSSICGHSDHCVIWKRSMGSESGQVVSTMCVCVCVCLATGCESVTVPSVIQAFQLRSALINHLPRHPAAFPLRHHNASIPQKTLLNAAHSAMLYRYPMRDYRNDNMKNIRAYRSDGTANSYRMTHTLTNAE